MQSLFLFILGINFACLDLSYLNFDDALTSLKTTRSDYREFEPVTTDFRHLDKTSAKNINCDDVSSYASNCTIDAASIYNSSRMSPPLTANIYYWCNAIRFITNCAIDWNADCKQVTDSLFNEESIKGHIHVINNICDDEWFLSRYEDLTNCVERTTDSWEICYITYKRAVEIQKNATNEWTHYKVHFQLCCARAHFRHCALKSFISSRCSYEEAVTLQKFSIIVSEWDVYQDCDNNIVYANCPGGDPRPSPAILRRLLIASASATLHICVRSFTYTSILIIFFLKYIITL